jgi:hypothetical protein
MTIVVNTIVTELGLSPSAAAKIIKLIQLRQPAGPYEDRIKVILVRFAPQHFIWTGTRLVPWEPYHEPAAATG